MYGLNYFSEFDNIAKQRYRLEIYRKGYSGGVTPMQMSNPSVLLIGNTDDPKAPIKGQALEMHITNPGNLPITSFYSDDDTAFMVKYYWLDLHLYSRPSDIVVTPSGGGSQIELVGTFVPTDIMNTASIISFNGVNYPISSFSYSGGVNTLIITPVAFTGSFSNITFTITYGNINLLFNGFVNQDDTSELLVDYNHEIVLTANDGLAMLKNTAFNQQLLDDSGVPIPFVIPFPYESLDFTTAAPHGIIISNTNFQPAVGQAINIKGDDGTLITGNITSVTPGSGFTTLTVDSTVITNATRTGFIYMLSEIDYTAKNSLAVIIIVCLRLTGLELNTNFYWNIFENSFTTNQSPLYQTYLDCNLFVNQDGSYQNCYDVLTSIITNLGTLMQSNCEWRFLRVDELRYSAPKKWTYGSDFFLKSTGIYDEYFPCGLSNNLIAINGILRLINRPYRYVKRTFDYQQPQNLTKNLDLQSLGVLLRQYTNGQTGVLLQTTYEYDAEFITNGPSNTGQIFIRVIQDYLNREIDRYLVLKGAPPFDEPTFGVFIPIEISQGDVIRWGFSVNTDHPPSSDMPFDVLLRTNTNIFLGNNTSSPKFVAGHTYWDTIRFLAAPYNNAAGEWTSVSFDESLPAPTDGLLYLYLSQVATNASSGGETHYKSFSLQIDHFINQSLKITGQVHDNVQQSFIKQNEDIAISLDDSPSNTIAGTLFLSIKNQITNVTARTGQWYRAGFSENRRLNDIATFEELFYKRISRARLDGSLTGRTDDGGFKFPLAENDIHISLLSLLRYDIFPGLNFIWGLLTIDFENNTVKGTLYEIYGDAEINNDGLLKNTYTFTYIYSTK